MGTHVIKMPDIGEGIAQVELVEWFVKVGDMIAEDQVVALGGQPGEVMAVGSELIRIEVEGSGNHVDVPQAKQVETPAAPVADKPEPQKDVKPAAYQAPANHEAAPIVPRQPGDKPLASPAVRKRALDTGIELRYVHGSGPAGRILHEDLDAFMSKPQSAAGQAPNGYAKRSDSEQVPVIGLRRKIAQRMQDAKRRVAHFSYVEEIDVTALEALRQQLNSKYGDSRGKLTLLPFLVRALVVALRDFPQINATYDDEAQIITRHGAVHVGIATQGDNGLMVPVLRHAEAGSLWANAGEISRLANAARSNKANREELSGSTITLTSLGALGGIVSTPVVNTPEVAIVGVNRMVERPVVIDGQIVVRKMMNLSSSFDHRVVDGMDAALFIQAVRGLLEQPACLFVE